MSKVIFLDRDGVINFDSDTYIRSPQQWQDIPGSVDAIKQLKKAGFHIVVVSNQSGLGRGYFDEKTLTSIHKKMQDATENKLDYILYCHHHPDELCQCRKPATGMLIEAQKRLGFNIKGSFFIGDNITDILCALNYELKPILVKTGKGAEYASKYFEFLTKHNVAIYEDLACAVRAILRNE